MPRKFEIEQERDALKAKMEEVHSILGEALGFDDEQDAEDDDLDDEDEVEEDE